MNDDDTSPLSELDPLEKLDANRLLTDLRGALIRAHEFGFYDRMLLNLNTRYCIWEGQSQDGRKWGTSNGKRPKPGDTPVDVFPFPGASDARVRKVDEICKERTGFKQAAYDRAEMQIGPRDLQTDRDLVEMSALWGMVANYYTEDSERELRRQARRWADLAETYGHGVLYNGWRVTKQLDRREISADKLMQLVAAVALRLAEARAKAQAAAAGMTLPVNSTSNSVLSPVDKDAVLTSAMTQLEAMINEPEQQQALAEALQRFDSGMTDAEARRVARLLGKQDLVTYHVPVIRDSGPDTRALTPFVDVFYPPETVCLKEALWIAMPEWVSDVTLRERVVTEGYDKATVQRVIEAGPGRCLDMMAEGKLGAKEYEWVASGGSVGKSLASSLKNTESRMWQIMHVYYRATTTSGVPALYHSIIFGAVTDKELKHECCEHAHGQYPFVEHMSQPERECLLACEGVGEISFTYQQEIKTQRDMRVDLSSQKIRPPAFVPLNHAGGRVDMRPGAQIPVRMTGGVGKPEFVTIPADPRGSQEVEKTTLQSLDELWFRGPTVDESVKLTMRQNLVNDFLSDLKAARKMMWELIQQFASEEVKAGVVGGIPANLDATRADIQGGTSLAMSFDVADLDLSLVEKKAKLFREVVAPLDRENLVPINEILRVVLAGIVPAWGRQMIRDPRKQAEDEAKDEEEILNKILNGIQSPYVPGKNHELRLQVLQGALARTTDDGQPTRVAKIVASDPDVRKLLQRRMEFHAVQVEQYRENPMIGRLGVEPVEYGRAPVDAAA